ncbi:MAG: YraN family protein [Deltaproteobacteria bacterium]|nr:YraN family protein [Deltaproteobacteria bacterium]
MAERSTTLGSSDSTTARGQRAEALACAHLIENGYRIIERNVRARIGEIDIVAEEGEVLCFVEVRSKHDAEHGDPLETINRPKQRRILRAAERYLAADQAQRYVRFDVIGIVYQPELQVTLVRDAFDATR